MPDTPSTPLPLDASPISCWRCGGPTRQRSGLLRFAPCEVCAQLLLEIQARYQGQRPAGDAEG